MCGIAGWYNPQGHSLQPAQLAAMLQAMHHRGPDARGIYLDDHAGLGHVRLSIIDLAGGNQPLCNEDHTVWVVYNGEIYNYPELRRDLVARGHRFSTTTDTEVLVHLYEEQGTGFLEQLNGQWAFALWDSRAKLFFAARDRYGVRPLHYTTVDGTLLFASEIKALFCLPGVSRELDPAGLEQVFTFWTTLPGATVWRGIQELPAGHFLVAGPQDRPCEVRPWYRLPFFPPDQWDRRGIDALTDEVRDLLVDAVRIRLRADVPVATYLSGGLDSSGVSAIVARRFNPEVQTFGIRFEEERFDEGGHQQAMVAQLGVRHHEVVATNERIAAAFGAVVRQCEKPLLRTAPVPLYLLARRVHEEGIKVVLTGEGADEFHGGYDIFKEALVRRFCARNPSSTWRGALFGRLYPDIFADARGRRAARAFFARGLETVDDPLFSHLLRWQNTARISLFFCQDMRASAGGFDALGASRRLLPDEFMSWHPLQRAQYLEIVIFLSNYLLSSQGDRMGMAHSVEVRMPYLDHRLNHLMGQVPSWMKICGLHEKHLLKRALAPFVPRSVVARVKHPYRAPIHRSLLALAGNDEGRSLLDPGALGRANIFDPQRVNALLSRLQQAETASETDSMALAGILSTQILHETYGARWSVPRPAGAIEILHDERTDGQ